jgi:hypothetical protein
MLVRGASLCLALCAALLVFAGSASASEIIDRNAAGVRLAVNRQGQALVSYRARGRQWRVLVWGAVNARRPHATVAQVRFRKDYSGGWGTHRKQVWKTFKNACTRYDGPALQWLKVGCRAPDGSYWAIQSWQRMLPNYGLVPNAKQAVWELRLSHWTGDLPQLQIKQDWAYRRYDHLYGTYAYLGHPIFGFRVTRTGVPLDTHGRNLYLDTFNSAYGAGWRRENSFLAQNPRGNFCYGFYPHGDRPSGKGERYRATIIGPGVTPDVYWEANAPGTYNRELDLVANEEQRAIVGDSRYCRPN